ncbi:13974_t:CDS:2 [Cetraspora pellucida]|uniref:13974_t:CDS:1 n=1 Tax=Cetraspora pellucida TaxID=1433469 RepID=A0ACA9K0C0_9GLOM|nr:13974_t:CDS:2 [Cetraspora pellucida]
MMVSTSNYTLTPPPTLISSNNQNIIFCFLCGQHFKTPGGLARHNTIIKKYNQSSKIVRIPKKVLKEFKQTLVFLIHQKLSNNFNHMGRQSFHVPCSEIIREEFQSPNKSNTLMVEESKMDIDLLLQLVVKKPQKQHRKPKFTYGEVLVEWHSKENFDVNIK